MFILFKGICLCFVKYLLIGLLGGLLGFFVGIVIGVMVWLIFFLLGDGGEVWEDDGRMICFLVMGLMFLVVMVWVNLVLIGVLMKGILLILRVGLGLVKNMMFFFLG